MGKLRGWMLVAGAAVMLAAVPLRAQEPAPKSLAGPWTGTLKVGAVELRLVFKLRESEGGKLTGVMVSPDQSPDEIPIDEVSVEGKTAKITIRKIGATFQGTVDDAKKEIAGEWAQGPVKLPLVLKPGDAAATTAEAPEPLLGLWEGTLDVGVAKLRLVLRVENKDGKRIAVLDSLDQNVNGIPLSSIALEGDTLTFESKGISASYKGKLDREKGVIDGTFTQFGQPRPLVLKKTEKVSELKRPQNPKEPYPYLTEEVTVPSPNGKLTLAGTLTLPPGPGPFPAVVLVTGSGPQDRDETLLGHKPFLVLADSLTRKGVAVLRCDDRGFGKSTGPGVMESTTAELADDALACVKFLAKHPKVDARRIGVAGHSEGGLVAPMVAARSSDVAFIVLLAGPGQTGEEILIAQNGLIARANGAKDAAVTEQVEGLRKLVAIIKSEADPAKAREQIQATLKSLVAAEKAAEKASAGGDAKSDTDKPADTDALATAASLQMNNRWFRFFLTYDPRPTLAQVKCPVLALNGEKDLQVPARENLAEIARVLQAAGNTKVETVALPDLNHLFQHAKTGSPSEYAGIEETMSPEVLEKVTTWILAQPPRP